LAPLDVPDARRLRVPVSTFNNARELPLPLQYQPTDLPGHDGAVVVGGIDKIWMDGGFLWGSGTFDSGDPVAVSVFGKVQRGFARHVSVDVEPRTFALLGATIVAKPAFGQAAIKEVAVTSGDVERAPMLTFSVSSPVSDVSGLSDHVEWSGGVCGGEAVRRARVAAAAYTAVAFGVEAETFNWVDDVGGLPGYIKRIARHLQRKGMTESRAVATAVNAVKRMCATGDLNWPGLQSVNPGSRAQACAAVASWNAKRARARAT
jgi:hypothetical protein